MRSGAGLEADRLDLGRAHLGKAAAAFGQTAERVIVVHHGFAVGTDLQIGLDAIAGRDRR